MLKRTTKFNSRFRFTGPSLAGCFVIAALCSGSNARSALPTLDAPTQTACVLDAKRLDALE